MDTFYPPSYDASRARFLHDVDLLRPKWHASRLESHPLQNHPDLSIDWFRAEPRLFLGYSSAAVDEISLNRTWVERSGRAHTPRLCARSAAYSIP